MTTDIRNAISAQWGIEHHRSVCACVYFFLSLLPSLLPFLIISMMFGHCMRPHMPKWSPLYAAGQLNACMSACVCVCSGLVGVTLGDGQPPIGRDLKRQALFFFFFFFPVNKD